MRIAGIRALAKAAKALRLVIFAVATILAVGWCLQNQGRVLVSFAPFAFGVELPLFLLVLAVFILGFALAALLSWPRQLRLQQQLRQARRRIHLLEHDTRQDQLHRQLSAEMHDDETPMAVPLADDDRLLPV